MALKIPYEVGCSCGENFQAELFEYVFAEYDPELKDMILSGEFNSLTCPSCREILNIENRFLYRDEKNRLWVWVCKKEDIHQEKGLERELIEKNAVIQGHHLDNQEDYRKFLVFGREGLIELLLKEDKALKRGEGKSLKKNPAIRLLTRGKGSHGYLFLSGKKIRLTLPLSMPRFFKRPLRNREEKEKWLKFYAQGVNIHNPFSSFLPHQSGKRWSRITEREPVGGIKNEFDDFAESWAGCRMDKKGFKAGYPERFKFFEGIKKIDISRKILTYKA